jgi:glutamyl-Q tRNA(Asp) synthetase
VITRFAPSPTGPLHLGHAFSALTAFDMAREAGGAFLLRIEDIDRTRSKPEWEALIFEDLAWLGLDWPRPVLRQSDRLPAYRAALETLWQAGLLYPCTCSRHEIQDAASAPQEGVRIGPDGIVYPGTCRNRARTGPLPEGVLRLDLRMALATIGECGFEETGPAHRGDHLLDPAALISDTGDVVLSRRDFGTSYHLSVIVDDAHQGVTHVVRGEDLFDATAVHVILQALLGLPRPVYHHHRLIRDETGRRLAKRDDARAIRLYRDEGRSPADIRAMVGLDAQSSG